MSWLTGRSLQVQLAVRLVVLYLAATAIGLGVLVYQAYSTADSLSDQDLSRRAEDLAGFVRPGDGGQKRIELPPKLASAYAAAGDTFLFALRGADGNVIAASHPQIGDTVARWPLAGEDPTFFRLEAFGPSGQNYHGLTGSFDSAAGPLSVTVARATDAQELVHSVLWEFVADISWVIPLVLAATMLIGVFGIRRSLRPVRDVSAQAASIEPGQLSLRLPTAELPTEIQPLVEAMNRALDRLERGFAVQRQFTANAAHELRTPLAILTAGLEQLHGNGELEKLRDDVARMNRIVEQLLRVARLDAVSLDVSDAVDLSAVANDVVTYMAPLAVTRGRLLAVHGTEHPVTVRGNRHAIEDALRNVVENALAHTPPRTEVLVAVDAGGSVQVSDRGPGVRDDERTHIFERFWRGKQAGRTGAGLGLAIVGEIMKAHHGRVVVEDSPEGGAVFTLVFRQIAAPERKQARPAVEAAP